MKKKIIAIVLIIVAIASVALGVVEMRKGAGNYSGRYVARQTYGGDAYTGIQNAAADTAFNVQQTNDILNSMHKTIAFGFGSILIVIGLALCVFGVALLIKKEQAADPAVKKAEPQAYVPSYLPKNMD